MAGRFSSTPVTQQKSTRAPIAWIIANQLGRRNLTPSQKAALAVEIEKQLALEASKRRAATLKQNQATVVATVPQREQGRARELAAEMVGVSPRYVQDAKQIEQDAPEILDQVKQGKLRAITGNATGEILSHHAGPQKKDASPRHRSAPRQE